MTREEAINEIKSWDFLEGKEIEAIQTLIPELRESEDERIRKEIIDFIDFIQWAEDRGMTRHDYHQAKRPAVWIAYLEKQKECVADNNKTSAEEDERIKARLIEYFQGFLEGYEDCYKDGGCVKWEGLDVKSILAWLEKQKENSKSVDSIPSDCVLNAKCEDRWYKVEDSLPDNGRLVLANDCLGNTLLARYDGEGNWEVSVYDNEDYYCRNTITKWCEIPSERQKEPENTSASVMIPSCWTEKQKEQKPAEVKDPFSNANFVRGYESGYADAKREQKPAEWSEEDKHNLNSVINLVHATTDEAWGSCIGDRIENWLKNLPKRFNLSSKQEWSEEDERKLQRCIEIVESWEGDYDIAYTPYSNFLKSLRPSWKPSEEQMKALCSKLPIIRGSGDKVQDILQTLYDDLKKLGVKEEPEYYQHFDPDC